jgi:hypothetical protein
MRTPSFAAFLVCLCLTSVATAQDTARFEYRVLATNKTSTMQKELNEAAAAGFRFAGVMGGDTAIGGKEVVIIMTRDPGARNADRFEYKLLATNKTSTMQKEMQHAGDAGFAYRGQTVFESMFGGKEVVTIFERDPAAPAARSEYRLLATKKTSTLQKELLDAGDAGYEYVGMTVGETLIGGSELVAILRRRTQ